MNGFGAKAYSRVEVESGVSEADPHRLILMLYDGVLSAIRSAEAHLRAGRTADKCAQLSKAVRIVEEGLKTSLDKDAGGPLAGQLAALYDYASLRLLQANMKNDHAALDEVARLLADLRDAWARIGRQAPAAPRPAHNAPPPTVGVAAPPAARFFDDASTGPVRRVVVTA
jgi:flagellar protein FliS